MIDTMAKDRAADRNSQLYKIFSVLGRKDERTETCPDMPID